MDNIKNTYNVSNYTDEELYQILDLDNPNDRILEAKIIQMINKYSSIGGESGIKLSKFFKDIYNHFFYNSDEETEPNKDNSELNIYFQEGYQGEEEEGYVEDSYQDVEEGYQDNEELNNNIQTNNTNNYFDRFKNLFISDGKVNVKEGFIANTQNTSVNSTINVNQASDFEFGTNQNTNLNPTFTNRNSNNIQNQTIEISGTTQLYGNGQIQSSNETNQSKSIIVNQLDYRKDYLNPLLKQTVKRIISIDSQYRDTVFYPYSTDFTFNLSEPLKDVVAIRMYSMQIPYSWYTINNNYGGNFFYLKGNTPGIDNGEFDYQISVPSGNYLPGILTSRVNDNINTLKTVYPDVSFGNTSISYDSPSNKSSIFIDIKNNFNESDYSVVFDVNTSLNRYPLAVGSNSNFLKYNEDGNASISSYFGFNNITYSGNCISTINKTGFSLGLSSYTQNEDNNTAKYILSNAPDNSNNYFTIYQYIGSSYSDALQNNKILFNTTIILNLSGSVTRKQIVDEINTQLNNNIYITNSQIQRIDITNINEQNYGSSTFKMDINWNKKTIPTANILDTKTAVIFSNELADTGNRIWTIGGTVSPSNICFYFPNTIMEVNDIYGETEINQTNYVITGNPSFKFRCNKIGYIGVKNDYTVSIANSTDTGYTLDQYLSAINSGIQATNTLSVNNSNLNGIFNLNNTQIFDDSTTQNKVSLKVDIAKSFTNIDGFLLDINETDLYNKYGFNTISEIDDFSAIDVSNTYIFTVDTTPSSTYSMSGYIFKIKPQYIQGSSTGVYDFGTWTVFPDFPGTNTYSLKNFSDNIQRSIRTFSDDGLTNPLSSSTFTGELIPNINKVRFTLTLLINKVLSEKDFIIDFIGTTWADNLKLTNPSYDLAENAVENSSYSQIFADSVLSGYAYYVNVPQTITIKARSIGVITDNNSNDIVLNIPPPTISNNGSNNYTIQQLFSLLNSQLTNNSYTKGSSFSLIERDGKKYIKLRLNINRLYTTNDYRLVFYDPFSFSRCIQGQNIATNVKWDATLGWILGFRNQTEYYLSSADSTSITNEKYLVGDTGVIISLYNYFLLVLDDYTQSHLNDGLITISKSYNDIPVFNSTVTNSFQCIDNGNTVAFTGTGTQVSNNKYTQKQIYAENQKYLSKKLKTSDYTTGPFANDVFALLPMKVTGLSVGATNVEFGGTLQNQERLYFGPVNIKRLSIKLLTDKGDVVDLNGQDWSFSFVCESLYQVKTVKNGGST